MEKKIKELYMLKDKKAKERLLENIDEIANAYKNKLMDKVRNWDRSQNTGLPQSGREIHTQTKGFIDGYKAALEAIAQLNGELNTISDYVAPQTEKDNYNIIPLTEENIRLLDERQELQEEAMGGCGYERRVILVEKIVAIEERLGIYGTPLSRILDLKGYLEMRYGK